MGSSILTLAGDAAAELGVETPATLFVNDEGDLTPGRLRRAVTRTVTRLAAAWDWQVLRKEKTFTTLNSVTQTGMVASDFLRSIEETFWDRTSQFQLTGPMTPQEWQSVVTNGTAGVVPYWCQRGNDILTYPAPAAGKTYAYEYIKNAVGTDAKGTDLTRFADDSDLTFWDDELITLGVIAYYRVIARLDSAQDMQDFQTMMAERIKADGGRRKINLSKSSASTAEDRIAALRNAAIVVNQPETWGGSDW